METKRYTLQTKNGNSNIDLLMEQKLSTESLGSHGSAHKPKIKTPIFISELNISGVLNNLSLWDK